MAKKRSLTSQALLEAGLQAAPQEQALAALLREALDQRSQAIDVARSNARGIRAVADTALPVVRRTFQDATQQTQGAHAQLAQALGGLSAAADPFKAASERDFAGSSSRLAQAMAGAVNETLQRPIDAAAGAAAASRAAESTYSHDRQRLVDQLLSLEGTKGANAQNILDKLQRAEAAQNITRRGQDITSRGQDLSHQDRQAAARQRAADRAAKDRLKHAGYLPGGIKPAAPDTVRTLRNSISLASTQLKGIDTKRGRAALIDLLTKGRPAQTIDDPDHVDPKTGKPLKLKVPGITAVPADAARIAVEILFDKGITPGTLKGLHAQGITAKRLGYKAVPRRGNRSVGKVVARPKRKSKSPAPSLFG